MSSTATESRPALNIKALRETQASIRNPNRQFHMGCWCHCIHGHAHEVLGLGESTIVCNPTVIRLLGLTDLEASDLFVPPNRATASREWAHQAIDRLIEAHSATTEYQPPAPVAEPERELVAV